MSKTIIYDNSNLSESYSGVTTPLTFSFAQSVYEDVYKHFCSLMGVSKRTIIRTADLFPDMLAYIGGRMYYNLLNWYRLVALLPGYQWNRTFFETMLGVEKSYTEEHTSIRTSWFVRCRFFFQAGKIICVWIFLNYFIRDFIRSFDREYMRVRRYQFPNLTLSELVNTYQELHARFVRRWRVPIANDFAVMVSVGILRTLWQRWLPDTDAVYLFRVERNRPLSTLDPQNRIRAIITLIRSLPAAHELFSHEQDCGNILLLLGTNQGLSEVFSVIQQYITDFGDRVPNELKLESQSLEERPESFIALLQSILQSDNPAGSTQTDDMGARAAAALPFLKRIVITWCRSWAHHSLARREETRFRRGLVFGLARRIFLEIGKRFHTKGLLVSERDIFFLTVSEITQWCRESVPAEEIQALVTERKNEYARWQTISTPRRIESTRTIADIEGELQSVHIPAAAHNTTLTGIVASSGSSPMITGEVVVLKQFDPSVDFSGKILVTSHTDPGWTPVFYVLAGVVVEHGGMLSHAAVVARELGIPCIIGAMHATDALLSGDMVTLDMRTGSIVRG